MSQPVGQVFKSRIPTLGDDASIQEALRVYHYGVDNYSTQTIPNDSIEGNFRSLDVRLDSVETVLSTGLTEYVRKESQTSSPNIIAGQATATIPLTIRAIALQTASLQQWQNSSSSPVASISTSGYFATAGYASIGSITQVATTALNTNIINPSNKGIVVKAAASQTANLQEWQNSSGTVLASISSDGSISTITNVTVSGDIASSGNVTVSGNLSVDGQITLQGNSIQDLLINPLMLIGS